MASRLVVNSLMTVWTPPSECMTAVANGQCFSTGRPCFLAWGSTNCTLDADYNSILPSDAASCWPPRATNAPEPSPPFNGLGVYSPGLQCPHGYTTACSASEGGSSDPNWTPVFPLEAKETAYGCCPTGYSCGLRSKGKAQACVSVASTSDTATFATCDGSTLGTVMFATMPAVTTTTAWISSIANGTLTSSTVIGETTGFQFSAFQPLIDMRVRPQDLLGGEKAQSADASVSSGESGDAAAASKGSGDGLPTGAKIAIGVAVPLFVLALLAFVMLILRKRRQQRMSDEQARITHPHPPPAPPTAQNPFVTSPSSFGNQPYMAADPTYAAHGTYARHNSNPHHQYPPGSAVGPDGAYMGSPLSAEESELYGSPVYELHGEMKAQELSPDKKHDMHMRSPA